MTDRPHRVLRRLLLLTMALAALGGIAGTSTANAATLTVTSSAGTDVVVGTSSSITAWLDPYEYAQYQWDVTGPEPVATDTWLSLWHTFYTPGSYTFTVTVTPSGDPPMTESITINVLPAPPRAWLDIRGKSVTLSSTADRLDVELTSKYNSYTSETTLTMSSATVPVFASVEGGGTCTSPDSTTASCTISDRSFWESTATITGTAANDHVVINGDWWTKSAIDLGDGNDTFSSLGSTSITSLNAGPGDDLLEFSGASTSDSADSKAHIIGGPGADTVSFARSPIGVEKGWDATRVIDADVETLVGSPRNDYLVAGLVPDVRAGAGNDTVTGGSVPAIIDLGTGNDTFVNAGTIAGAQRVIGGAGRDMYVATDRQPHFLCLAAAPICPAFDGRKGEKDRVGFDVEDVHLGSGDDFIVTSKASNRVSASYGDDYIVASPGLDTYDGGSGVDVVSYELRQLQSRPVNINTNGRRNDGNPRKGLIESDIEVIAGTNFSDVVTGSGRGEALVGLAGNDRIVGGRGSDYLDGGPGNDTIDARDGSGHDVVKCGKGRDTVKADAGDKVAKDCEIRR